MLVESIGFSVRDDGWFSTQGQGEWDLKLGQAQLTKGFVPITSCVRDEERYENVSTNASYIWNLPRPCYVPRGRSIHPQIKSLSGSGPAASAATFFVRGRKLPEDYPVPATTMVPYATAYRSPVIDLTTALTDPRLGIFKSGASDLVNPFQVPLNVQRFIAEALGDSISSPQTQLIEFITGSHFALVQLFDHTGAPISREPVRLSELCQATYRDWSIPFILPPLARIYASIDLTHPTYPGGIGFQTSYQMSLGLVGWREVPLSEVM